MSMFEVPEIRVELERKTLETYQWLINRSVDGQFADSEIRVALQAIFNTVSGLIDREILDAAGMVEVSPEPFVHRRVFMRSEQTFVVSWAQGSTTVSMHTPKGYKEFAADSPAGGRILFSQLCEALLKNNVTEIL